MYAGGSVRGPRKQPLYRGSVVAWLISLCHDARVDHARKIGNANAYVDMCIYICVSTLNNETSLIKGPTL